MVAHATMLTNYLRRGTPPTSNRVPAAVIPSRTPRRLGFFQIPTSSQFHSVCGSNALNHPRLSSRTIVRSNLLLPMPLLTPAPDAVSIGYLARTLSGLHTLANFVRPVATACCRYAIRYPYRPRTRILLPITTQRRGTWPSPPRPYL